MLFSSMYSSGEKKKVTQLKITPHEKNHAGPAEVPKIWKGQACNDNDSFFRKVCLRIWNFGKKHRQKTFFIQLILNFTTHFYYWSWLVKKERNPTFPKIIMQSCKTWWWTLIIQCSDFTPKCLRIRWALWYL